MKLCKSAFHEGQNPLPFDQFSKRTLAADGYQSWCKRCSATVNRKKREESARLQGRHLRPRYHTRISSGEHSEHSPRTKVESERLYRQRLNQRMTPELKVRLLLRVIKQRARKNNIPFNISLVDLIPLPDTCPDLGVSLSYNNTRKHEANSVTIDRIVPMLGYVPGNVRVVSYKANAMKQNATLEEMKTIAESWLLLVEQRKN